MKVEECESSAIFTTLETRRQYPPVQLTNNVIPLAFNQTKRYVMTQSAYSF